MTNDIGSLSQHISACILCKNLPLGPKPIFQMGSSAKILIAGQAPGAKTHAKGRPFDDQSGIRLRKWLGVSDAQFYDPDLFAIVPMGFCFPGTGKGGDLPPRTECATAWRRPVLKLLPNIELTLILGQYALDWHVGDRKSKTLTDTVKRWKEFWPASLPLPHPSPRNMRWFKANPWFAEDVIPRLQNRVENLIASGS